VFTNMTNRTTTRKIKNTPQKSNGPGRNYEVIKHFEPSAKSVRPGYDEQSPIPLVNAENDKPTNNLRQGPKKPQRKAPLTNATTVQGVTAKNTKKVWKSPLKSSSSSSLESKLQKFTNKYTVRSRSFHAGASQDSKPITKSRNLKSATDPQLVHLDSLKQEIIENKLQQTSGAYCDYASGTLNLKPVEDLKAEIDQTRSSNMQHKKMLITELRSEIAQYKQFSSFQVYNSYEKRDGDRKKVEIENGSGSSEGEVSSIRPGKFFIDDFVYI